MVAKHGPRTANRAAIGFYTRAVERTGRGWKDYALAADADERVAAQAHVDKCYREQSEAHDVLTRLLDDYETIRIRERQREEG
jgi:hypothetical protein